MNFFINQNDTSPEIEYDLYSKGELVNLTGASVQFVMGALVDAPGVIVNNTGRVKYVWVEGDTAIAGTHKANFQVIFANGKRETYPNDGYLMIVINPEL